MHGVYPYFSFPFEAEKHIDKQSFFRKLMQDLDRKTAFSGSDSDGHNRVTAQVHCIEEVKAMKLYGYHQHEEPFLKVQFYNPFSVQKASELLSDRKLLNLSVQAYQSHIPYILQVSFVSCVDSF